MQFEVVFDSLSLAKEFMGHVSSVCAETNLKVNKHVYIYVISVQCYIMLSNVVYTLILLLGIFEGS